MAMLIPLRGRVGRKRFHPTKGYAPSLPVSSEAHPLAVFIPMHCIATLEPLVVDGVTGWVNSWLAAFMSAHGSSASQ